MQSHLHAFCGWLGEATQHAHEAKRSRDGWSVMAVTRRSQMRSHAREIRARAASSMPPPAALPAPSAERRGGERSRNTKSRATKTIGWYPCLLLRRPPRVSLPIRASRRATRVWSKNSSGDSPTRSRRFAVVITQEPTQSLAALHRPLATNVRIPREQQDIALPLMIPLGMEMLDVFAQRLPQGALPEENHLGQALLLH